MLIAFMVRGLPKPGIFVKGLIKLLVILISPRENAGYKTVVLTNFSLTSVVAMFNLNECLNYFKVTEWQVDLIQKLEYLMPLKNCSPNGVFLKLPCD